MARVLDAVWLGRRPYAPVHALQERLLAERREGRIGDSVLFLEHEPVITLGRGAKAEHVLASESALSESGVSVVKTGRGGDVTVHAPGQLVCYPILDLAPDRCDVRRYVKDLTETMRRVLLEHGVATGSMERYVGLWADREEPAVWRGERHARRPAKIGAIGVRISRWITMHGFALNLHNDLSIFSAIVPCGIREHGVTSVRELTDAAPAVRAVAARALLHLCSVFDAENSGLRDVSSEPLALDAAFATPLHA